MVTKFKVVSKIRFDGSLETNTVAIGEIVTLGFNDNTNAPRFRKGDNPSIYVNWCYLAPFQVDDQIFKEGDTVQVTTLETTHRGGGNWTNHIGYLGKTCILTKLNAEELNKNHEVTILAGLSGVNWHRSMLKVISNNSNNSNNEKSNNSNSNSNSNSNDLPGTHFSEQSGCSTGAVRFPSTRISIKLQEGYPGYQAGNFQSKPRIG